MCPSLAEKGSSYCSIHKPAIRKQYDDSRGTAKERGYDHTWRRLRRIKLSNNPLCELCLSKDIVVQASQVDHIIPVSQQPELRLVYDNLQSLCETCHSKKTREENKK